LVSSGADLKSNQKSFTRTHCSLKLRPDFVSDFHTVSK